MSGVGAARGRKRPRSRVERLAACFGGHIPGRVDWVQVVADANAHLVGPALYRALSDVEERVDPDALAYLGALDAANRCRNQRLHDDVAEIAAALNRDGIVPILIKGAGLLASAPEPAALPRMITDIDLVSDDPTAVAETLRGLGYGCVPDTVGKHSIGSFWRPGAAGAIDVHWTLPDAIARLVTADELYRHVRPVPVGSARVAIPDPSLSLLVTVAHEMLHDGGMLRGKVAVRYLLDLSDLFASGAEIDWDWIGRKRSDRPFALALDLQLRMVQRLLGVGPGPIASGPMFAAIDAHRMIRLRSPLIEGIERGLNRSVLPLVLGAASLVQGGRVNQTGSRPIFPARSG